MAKNNPFGGGGFDNYDDPLYSDELDTLAEENKQMQIASYVAVDVNKAEVDIQTAATKFVSNIVKLYHKSEKSIKDDLYFDEDAAEQQGAGNQTMSELVESISAIETVNLAMLLKQVKWADHLVSTLMRRLEAGGSMDTDLIDKIMAAQQSSMNLTLTISSYTRSLPTYFKSLKADLEEGNPINTDEMLRITENTTGALLLEETSQNPAQPLDEFDIAKPQKGMRDLLKNINKARKEIEEEQKGSDKGDEVEYEEVP